MELTRCQLVSSGGVGVVWVSVAIGADEGALEEEEEEEMVVLVVKIGRRRGPLKSSRYWIFGFT